MKFHLDLDGVGLVRQEASRADASAAGPVFDLARGRDGHSTDREGPVGRRVRNAELREPDTHPAPPQLPVLRQAVASSAVTALPAWFTAPVSEGVMLVIPAGARIRGDCCADSVWVQGEVTGRVHATKGLLVVSAGACVRGSLEGMGPVVIAGQVIAARGRDAVVAHGRLDVAGSARITGDVRHDVVAVYEGARVAGALRCLDRRDRHG